MAIVLLFNMLPHVLYGASVLMSVLLGANIRIPTIVDSGSPYLGRLASSRQRLTLTHSCQRAGFDDGWFATLQPSVTVIYY
jgi:hypothetical protein